ncbi:10161_t:CDS:2, partial [Scutellospora calospora]
LNTAVLYNENDNNFRDLNEEKYSQHGVMKLGSEEAYISTLCSKIISNYRKFLIKHRLDEFNKVCDIGGDMEEVTIAHAIKWSTEAWQK